MFRYGRKGAGKHCCVGGSGRNRVYTKMLGVPKKYYFTFCLIYSMIWQCDCIDIADNGDLLVTMGGRG